VPDPHRALRAEVVDQLQHVGDDVLLRVRVGRRVRRGAAVAAHVGRHRPEAQAREHRQLVPPADRQLGPAVQEQHHGPVLGACREVPGDMPVGAQGVLEDLRHRGGQSRWSTTFTTLPVGRPYQEPAHAPRLLRQRAHDLEAHLLRLRPGGVDVVGGHRHHRVLRRGGVARDELDPARRSRAGEAGHPSQVELFGGEPEEVGVEGLRRVDVGHPEIGDDAVGAHVLPLFASAGYNPRGERHCVVSYTKSNLVTR
jgi:hypothetical protein